MGLPAVSDVTCGKKEAAWLGQLGARGMRTLNPVGSEEAERVELRILRHQEDDDVFGVSAVNEQVARHRNRIMAADAFAKARISCAQRRLQEARRILQEAVDKLASSPLAQQGDALSVGLLTDLLECLEDLMDNCNTEAHHSAQKASKADYADYDHKYSKKDDKDVGKCSKACKKMAACHETHTRERKTGGASQSSMMYENTTQKMMKSSFKSNVK